MRDGEIRNILFLCADINGYSRTSFDREVREIETRLGKRSHRRRLRLIPKLAVRITDMLAALNEYRPDIVHFTGHGTPSGEHCSLYLFAAGQHDTGRRIYQENHDSEHSRSSRSCSTWATLRRSRSGLGTCLSLRSRRWSPHIAPHPLLLGSVLRAANASVWPFCGSFCFLSSVHCGPVRVHHRRR